MSGFEGWTPEHGERVEWSASALLASGYGAMALAPEPFASIHDLEPGASVRASTISGSYVVQ